MFVSNWVHFAYNQWISCQVIEPLLTHYLWTREHQKNIINAINTTTQWLPLVSHLFQSVLSDAKAVYSDLFAHLLFKLSSGMSPSHPCPPIPHWMSIRVQSVQSCPFDSTPIETRLPENEAILGLIQLNGCPNGSNSSQPNSRSNDRPVVQSYDCVDIQDIPYYRKCIDCIKQMALLLRPQQQSQSSLSLLSALSWSLDSIIMSFRPIVVASDAEEVNHSIALSGGWGRGSEPCAQECAVYWWASVGWAPHQTSGLISTQVCFHSYVISWSHFVCLFSSNLWAAVRARGCQFLGPAMQEEVLRFGILSVGYNPLNWWHCLPFVSID